MANHVLLKEWWSLAPQEFNWEMSDEEIIEALKQAIDKRNWDYELRTVGNCHFARVNSSYRTDYGSLVNPFLRAYIARLKDEVSR